MPTSPLEPDATFDEAFDGLARVAYRVAYRLLGSRPDAEDVAQEALTRACLRWRRVAGHAEPWVARVAANLALDQLRVRRRRPTGDGGGTEPPASEGPSTVDRLELVRLLEDLPRRQREVLVLRYLGDLTEAATARELGTSVGSVKQHAHRALAALRVAWGDPAEVDVAGLATGSLPETGGR